MTGVTAMMAAGAHSSRRRISVTVTLSSNTTNYTLDTAQIPGYSAGQTDVTLVIDSNVYVYSTNTSVAGLTISALGASDTVTVTNNGYILGMGGNGASVGYGPGGITLGQPGGPALSINRNVTITNNSYIAGGGGGGSGYWYRSNVYGDSETGGASGGGGAGGGAGGSAYGGYYAGGAGGGPGQNGSNGTQPGFTGAGGGRILPGIGGTPTSYSLAQGGGAGGSGIERNGFSDYNGQYEILISSGGGGGWGASGGHVGTSGVIPNTNSGTGGSSNGAGYSGFSGIQGGGAAGGKAVNLNGYTVTWLAEGTRWGTIS